MAGRLPLAIRPKCIIMDESTAMLDPVGRKEVLAAAKKLNREEGMTVIWITHYMEEVVDADKVFVMSGGKVVMQGTPREVFRREKELSEYRLDVPQATRIASRLRQKGFDIPEGVLTVRELTDAVARIAGKDQGHK